MKKEALFFTTSHSTKGNPNDYRILKNIYCEDELIHVYSKGFTQDAWVAQTLNISKVVKTGPWLAPER